METDGITVMEGVRLPEIEEHLSRDRKILTINEYSGDTNDQFCIFR